MSMTSKFFSKLHHFNFIHYRAIVTFPEVELTTSQLVPAFVAALSVFSILTIFSYISVVHMNPTVTFALFFSGVFDARLILPYIMAQLLGAPEGSAYRDFWLVFSIFVCFILCYII